MSAWTCRQRAGKADPKIVPPRSRIPSWKGLCADSEEKHEPASDIDTVLVDRLKALDPNRPIREADIGVHRKCPLSRVKRTYRFDPQETSGLSIGLVRHTGKPAEVGSPRAVCGPLCIAANVLYSPSRRARMAAPEEINAA